MFLLLYLNYLVIWWVLDYYWLNQYVFFIKNVPIYFNNLLSNPLNKYHPVLFFSCYLFTYVVLAYTNLFINTRDYNLQKYIYNTYYFNFLKRNNLYWPLLTTSLYLGAWWALQEGSWGGWWNWDASEVFGLLILTFILVYFHLKKYVYSVFIRFYLSYTYILFILFAYLILQLSYNLTSHNFGLSLIGYGYVTTTFKQLLLSVGLLTVLFMYSLCKTTPTIINYPSFRVYSILRNTFLKTTPYNLKLNPTYLIMSVVSCIVFYLYLLSFNSIISNIFWSTLSLEVLNTLMTEVDPKLLLLLILVIFLVKIDSVVFILTLLVNCYSFNNHIITYFFFKNTYIYKVYHTVIIVLLFITMWLTVVLYTDWQSVYNSHIDWLSSYYRSPFIYNMSINNTYVLISTDGFGNSGILSANSFFWLFTNIDSQFFGLHLTTSILKQVIYSHTCMYLFRVVVWDIPSFVTDTGFIFFLLYTIYIFFLKNKITF